MNKYLPLVQNKYYITYFIYFVLFIIKSKLPEGNFKSFLFKYRQALNWIFIITAITLINSSIKTKKRINMVAFGLIAVILGIQQVIKYINMGRPPQDWTFVEEYIIFTLTSVILYPIILSLILHKL